VISRSELLFQLANVTGAAIAVLVYPGPRVGFAAVAAALILGGVTYASHLRLTLRNEAGRWLLGRQPRTGTLPLALLAEAMRFADQGDHYVAVVVADSAVRVLDARTKAPAESVAQPRWAALEEVVAAVAAGTLDPTGDTSLDVITAAAAVFAERTVRSGERSSGRGGG
jgi:hypothetical protein